MCIRFLGSVAEFVGENGAFQQAAGESVTRGDRRRRELVSSEAVAAARPPPAEKRDRLRGCDVRSGKVCLRSASLCPR